MSVPWPPCEQAYEAYGMAVDICEVAGELWRSVGEQLALSDVGDVALGFDLMIEASVNVTRYRVAHPDKEIRNVRAYILTSYKHLLSAEREKRSRFDLIQEDRPKKEPEDKANRGVVPTSDPSQERKATFQETLRRMARFDEKLYQVFRFRAAGYTYKEIGPHYRMDEDHLRSWFSKRMEQFKKHLEKTAKETKGTPKA